MVVHISQGKDSAVFVQNISGTRDGNMKKKKPNFLETVYDAYADRVQDLLCNPITEDKSNEEIDPLFDEADKTMPDALLVDEDGTCKLLSNETAFSFRYDFSLQFISVSDLRNLPRCLLTTCR